MPETLLIVPSRGRPDNIRRLTKALQVTGSNVDLVVAVDDDDPQLAEYTRLENLWVDVAPRQPMARILDRVAVAHAGDYGSVGFMGDDHLPETYEWDRHLRDAIGAQGGGFAYGDDGIMGRNLPTAVLMSSEVPLALGRVTPPGCLHCYLDNHWRDLGHALGQIAYREWVKITHLHPIAGKAKSDETYVQANSSMDADGAAYDRYVDTGGLEADVTAIRQWRAGRA